MAAAELLADARHAREQGKLGDCRADAFYAALAAQDERRWADLYHSLACVGRAHLHRGEPEEARDWFGFAWDAVHEHELTRWRGPAAHDLFLCERDLGDTAAARRWIEVAWDSYGGRHPRMGAFLADLTVFQRPPETWHPLFLPYATGADRTDRVVALANLLESAAARNARETGLTLWLALKAEIQEGSGIALCLTHAAEALGRLGHHEIAADAATWAGEMAERRGEGCVRERAEHARDLALAERAPG